MELTKKKSTESGYADFSMVLLMPFNPGNTTHTRHVTWQIFNLPKKKKKKKNKTVLVSKLSHEYNFCLPKL